MFVIFRNWPIILLLALAIAVRFVWLDMDPPILLSYGQIGDEGLWTHNARLKVLFGQRTVDTFSHDYAVAPLFSWVVEESFRLFGVNFFSARFPSALFGFLTLLPAYDIARRVFSRKRAVLVLLLLSIHPSWLVHNRLAVAESLMIFLLMLSWWLWVVGRHRRDYFLGGLLLGLAILAKSTSVQYLGVFVLFVLSSWFVFRERKKTVSFVAGFISAAIFVTWFFWTERESVVPIFSTFARVYSWENAANFEQVVTSIIFHPFWGSPFIVGLVGLALFNCIGLGKLFLLSREKFWKETHPVIRQSFTWLIAGTLPALFGANHPSTRYYPLVLPIILLALKEPTQVRQAINGKVAHCLNGCLLFILSLMGTKLVLAIARRIVLSPEVQGVLFWPIAIVFFLLSIVLFWRLRYLSFFLTKHRLTVSKLVLGFILLSIFTQFLLDWFMPLSSFSSNAITKNGIVAALGSVIYLIKDKLSAVNILLAEVALSLIVLVVIFGNPSFSIRDSSRRLQALLLRREYTVGFLAHEMSLENAASYPIYWGPRQPFVGAFNEQYAKTLPTVLLAPEYLEGQLVSQVNTWPGLADYPKRRSERIGMLTWHRSWGPFVRDVQIGVYSLY